MATYSSQGRTLQTINFSFGNWMLKGTAKLFWKGSECAETSVLFTSLAI